jgi:hypothetical protein
MGKCMIYKIMFINVDTDEVEEDLLDKDVTVEAESEEEAQDKVDEVLEDNKIDSIRLICYVDADMCDETVYVGVQEL